ncbi:UPF0481 protein At3g47200-like [Arachis stenosperma]|uniref:UPF0481 protein At3g47200-like n=1 Tax=Arachis stenosperma TaxID=217475 RepID=UPI0025ABEE48|nr:UPF0481 protein At3g47200-like [Arachis stenosperma]
MDMHKRRKNFMETSINKSKELLKSLDHGHVSDISMSEVNKDLVASIKEKLEAITSLKSIFRVPRKLLQANQKVYVPTKVSIGPLHHGKENLKDMQDHKWHYLYTLLSREPNMEASLHECLKALRESEKTARNFYAEELNLTSDEFVEIMLLDGCFIIELLLKYAMKSVRRLADPIFATPRLLYDIRCDLILLENQIPLIILQRLFEIVPIPVKCNRTLPELAIFFFRNMLPGDRECVTMRFGQEGNHLLDLFQQCYLPTYARAQSKKLPTVEDLKYICATKLRKYGIKLMRFTAKSLLDIDFHNGVLEIAPLVTHQFTEILFSNLIALEQHQKDVQPFTSYAFLMKNIISDENDAKLVRHLRIVASEKGTEKNVCDLFKGLCEGVEYAAEKFYFAGLHEQITEYNTNRRSWWKKVKSNCLKTCTCT